MRHSTRRPTKAEAARMERLSQMRCIACQFASSGIPGVEVHHLLSGNRRRGHLYTIPLCRWHHRGVVTPYTKRHLEASAGPSLACNSRAFHIRFGTDDELLEMTNKLLGEH